jgi:nuclear autoantigenic sperm protein
LILLKKGSKDEKEEENGVEENGVDNAEAGTSKAAEEGDEADAEGDDEEGGNLEVAWEVLQNAAMIFERVGGNKLKGLMDTYVEMAGISLENGNFDASVTDFNRALAVFEDLDEADQNQRVAAEVNYKVGLCHMMEKRYDESMKSFQKAADIFEEVIKREKAREEQTEDDKSKIKDLEETLNELLNKISEVRDTKAEELEFVKREMMKMYGGVTGAGGSSSSTYDAGASSSSSGGIQSSSSSAAIVVDENKPKATDISHLIKRKKPDSDPIQESPAKKQLVETSPGEKIAFPSDKIAEDETPKVEVVNN